jgi:DNA (cytosine-5)-methyltransferase 3A
MKILSLFDGMACGMIAMLNAGIEVERYDAYEIDKYAIKVSSHNFPNIKHHGDVFQADFTQYEGVDFLVGGSPCTYWSIAQKNNRETEASGMGWELFSQYVRAVKEAKPKFFIYENNKSMSAAIQESIDRAFGFEAILINSALVSAQNRQRLYWVGMRNEDGTYSKVPVDQPEDRGLLLRDVLDGIGAKGLSEREMDYMVRSSTGKYSDRWAYLQKPGQNDKSLCITANISKGVPYNICAEPVNTTQNGKGHTLKAQYYKNGVANFVTNGGFDATAVAEPINITPDGKARTIRATCYKDGIRNMVGNDVDRRTCVAESICESKTVLKAISVEWDENGVPNKAVSYADGKAYPVYRVENGQITIRGKQYPIKLVDGYYIIRKLTITECMRLQTVPEWYDFSMISNSQAYKCLGNGWTCDVITHLINATQKVARRKWLDSLLGGCL